MVNYRPVFEKLRGQNTSHEDGDAILSWLNTSCNSPSHFQDIAPPASPRSTFSPPATPPHLRKRKRPLKQKPPQPSNGHQGPPNSKRKMSNRGDDAEGQLPRELRDKAGLRKPARYREEEQVIYSQMSLARRLGSPQKQQVRGRGRGITSRQGRAARSGQQVAGQGLVAYDIVLGNPTTPMKGQGRGSSFPTRRPQSASKSLRASDRTCWMVRLEPGVRFLQSECLRNRDVTASARHFWLEYIRSHDNECFIPIYFQVSNTLSVPCPLLCVC